MSVYRSKLKLVSRAAGAAAVLTVLANPASAQTSNLSVTASVSASCTISTTTVAFGAYNPIGANASVGLDGTGAVTITCTQGTTPTLSLGLGSNASGTVRRMANGTARLQYELYKDSSHTSVWGDGVNANTVASAPSTAPRSFTVYGRVAATQDVPVGSYTDTVVATVNF